MSKSWHEVSCPGRALWYSNTVPAHSHESLLSNLETANLRNELLRETIADLEAEIKALQSGMEESKATSQRAKGEVGCSAESFGFPSFDEILLSGIRSNPSDRCVE